MALTLVTAFINTHNLATKMTVEMADRYIPSSSSDHEDSNSMGDNEFGL